MPVETHRVAARPGEAQERLPRPDPHRVTVECLVCGKRFVQESRSPRLYCDAKCRGAAYRAAERGEATGRKTQNRPGRARGPGGGSNGGGLDLWGGAHPIGRYRTISEWARTPPSARTQAPKTLPL